MSRRKPRSKIFFPPLSTPQQCLALLRQHFRWARGERIRTEERGSARYVYGVFERGVLRSWSVKRAGAASWAYRHCWEPWAISKITEAMLP